MTCGRTDHTKFASAPEATATVSPPASVPAGTYDNRRTMCRERWAWNYGTKRTELCHQISAEALSQRDSLGISWPVWGTYPDLPSGASFGGDALYGDGK